MRTRSKIHWFAILSGVLVLSANALVTTVLGEEIRFLVPQLTGTCVYGQELGPAPFDVGSCLATVSVIRVEIAGTYAMGWWDGDDIEDFYHGPRGSIVNFEMNRAAGWSSRWSGSAGFGTNGPFSQTITLGPQGMNASWDFLRNGTNELQVNHAIWVGWGRMTILPQISISSLTVAVEAERLLRIVSFSCDGALCWSRMPAEGVICVHFAPEVTGPWSIVATNSSSNTCCNVPLPGGGNPGFYRIVHTNN